MADRNDLLTEWEREAVELLVQWREAKHEPSEAVLAQKILHAVDMIRKERRGKDGISASDGR